MNFEESDKWLWDQCRECAASWFRQQTQDRFAMLYVYFKPGAIAVWTDLPHGEGWELGTGLRVNPMWTPEQVKFWIYGQARKWNCLPA